MEIDNSFTKVTTVLQTFWNKKYLAKSMVSCSITSFETRSSIMSMLSDQPNR